MGTYAFYGILVLCICFIQTFCYERCTYGTYYRYCDTGLCCKISGTWYCTGKGLSTSDCDSFSQTTTTKAPTSSSLVPLYAVGAIVGIIVLAVILGCAVVRLQKKQARLSPLPVVQSSTQPQGGIYYIQGARGNSRDSTATYAPKLNNY